MFDLIRENNLFTDVRDQVLLLVQFDDELMKQRKKEGKETNEGKSDAITLLVDNIHSIPVSFLRKSILCCYLSKHFNFRLDALYNNWKAAHITCFSISMRWSSKKILN